METRWTDEQLKRALKRIGIHPDGTSEWGDRVWARIESRLMKEKDQKAWSFQSHPLRWGAATAMLVMVYSGVWMRQIHLENEMAGYVAELTGASLTDTLLEEPIAVSEILTGSQFGDNVILESEEGPSDIYDDLLEI